MATWRAAKGPGSSVRSAVAGLAAVWGGQAAAGSPAGEPPHIPLCCLRVPAAGEQAAVSSLATARPPGQDPAAGTVRQRRQRSRQSRRSEPAAGGACQRASRPALAAVHAVINGDRICLGPPPRRPLEMRAAVLGASRDPGSGLLRSSPVGRRSRRTPARPQLQARPWSRLELSGPAMG